MLSITIFSRRENERHLSFPIEGLDKSQKKGHPEHDSGSTVSLAFKVSDSGLSPNDSWLTFTMSWDRNPTLPKDHQVENGEMTVPNI